MKIFSLLFVLFFFSALGNALAAEKKLLCPALEICLGEVLPECSKEDRVKNKRIKYNAEFCAPIKEAKARELSTHSFVGKEIYSKLGSEYRVTYESRGTLSVTQDMLSFLFDHMPFTAKLINAYRDAHYDLRYTNKMHTAFSADNGRSLSGDFFWALNDSAGVKLGARNLFLGYGRAKVLRWQLHGTAVAFLDFYPRGNGKIDYRLSAIVFPANSILNSIMQMQVFKKVVGEKIDLIVKDVVSSAKSFADGNKNPLAENGVLLSKPWVHTLREFEKVIQGAPWKLGDALKKEKENGKK